MKKIRFQAALVVALGLIATIGMAQNSGEAIYKAKCTNCHGAKGLADTSMGKALKVKPITDPSVKKFTLAEMVAATQNGMGKMQPYKNSLTDAQIKASVDYFRSLSK